jgi:hypothetical protein
VSSTFWVQRKGLHRSSGGEKDYEEGEFEEPRVNDPRAKKNLQEEKVHLDAGPAENNARVSTLMSNF